jgi:peroxiredoxin
MRTLFILAILLLSFTFAFAQNEQAPVVEKELAYKDWTYKNIGTDAQVNLRDFAKGKKLVLVVYFAPWCPNWRHEAPFVQRMYEKYKAAGFDVIGVGEYQDSPEQMKTNLETFKITFPVVLESDSRAAKQTTLHYGYRRFVGDTRNWGSPWNIFLQPALLEKKGDVLLKKAFIVNGELIEAEAETFIREKLGLPKEEKKADAALGKKDTEICTPEKKTPEFIKP